MKWKPIKTNRRCTALDQDGKRCRHKAIWAGPYHGDSEIYSTLMNGDDSPRWVRVEFCGVHASKSP